MIFAPLVCIVGLILYLASDKPKVARVGEIMFFLGLAFTLYLFGNWKVF